MQNWELDWKSTCKTVPIAIPVQFRRGGIRKTNMENSRSAVIELDFRQLFATLLRHAVFIICCALAGMIAFGAVSYYLIAPKYTSSVSMYVNNTNGSGAGVTNGININDINASQKLVDTYIVILRNNEVMNAVAEQLEKEFTSEQFQEYIDADKPTAGVIRSLVSMSSVNGTEVMEIKAITKNAKFSAAICNTIAEIAPETLKRVVKAGSVETIGTAEPAGAQSSPNVIKNAVFGLLAGLALSVAFVLLLAMLDTTIKGEEDLKSRTGLTVLGEIPDVQYKSKDAYKDDYQYGR